MSFAAYESLQGVLALCGNHSSGLPGQRALAEEKRMGTLFISIFILNNAVLPKKSWFSCYFKVYKK